MSDRFTKRIYLALAEGRDLSSDEERHLATCVDCRAAAERAREFEGALHRELAELRAPMPADPFAVTDARRDSRPLAPLLLGLVVALTAAVAGVALLSSPDPDPSPEPSTIAMASPSASPTPSASASTVPSATPPAEPTPADESLRAGDFAVAVVAELPLHDRPGGTAFAMVQPGPELYVLDVRDGWYEIEEASWLGFQFGWVPAVQPADGPGGSGEPVPTLERHSRAECLQTEPGDPSWLGSGHPQWDLECYGDAGTVVVEGYAIDVSQREVMWPYTGEPSWLAAPPLLELSSVIGPAVSGFSVGLHLPPDLDGTIPTSDREAHDGVRLAVTGHFDDPRSSTCTIVARVEGYPPVQAANAELWCRQQFVVDRVEVVEPGD